MSSEPLHAPRAPRGDGSNGRQAGADQARSTAEDHAGQVSTAAPARSRRLFILSAILAAAISGTAIALKEAPVPFFWAWLAWALAFFAAMYPVRGDWYRSALLCLGVLACVLATLEATLSTREYVPPVYPEGSLYDHNEILGWAPKKGATVRAIKPEPAGVFHHSRGMLFDIQYTIDSDGLRVAPPYLKDGLTATVVFFGCSFAFGEGLPDNQTLPYQVGLQSAGRIRTLNFGVGGYGSQQMLSAIEHGLVSQLAGQAPQHAIYVALPAHVWRVAGRVAWGGQAPRYVLDEHGQVRQEGQLEDKPSLADRLHLKHGVRQLNKSAIWRALSSRDVPVTDEDIRLYLAVVSRSRKLLETQFPGIQFHILLWPDEAAPQEQSVYKRLQEEFMRSGYSLYLVNDILPGYKKDDAPYVLSSVDHHPNALADRLLAQFVLNQILK